jgi:hypothetical protein
MIELLRSNDPVILSFAEALLKDAAIGYQIVDGHMSIAEGSLGILPRRILVIRDSLDIARRILTEAGLKQELS